MIYDNPLNPDSVNEIKIVNIAFDSSTSHYAIFKQIVDGLKKAKYAPKEEILDIFRENL